VKPGPLESARFGEEALGFEAVSVRLGGTPVLRGVTLSLGAGEVLTLAGPNGAGKTTLFRVASRVLRPDAGHVRVFGRPLESLSRRELARELAVVPQDAAIAFPFSAAEVVLMGRSPHLGPLGFEGERDVALARDAMARVGIEHLAPRAMPGLSGGERQLVLLARALAQDPRILLLDEPTAHLDLRHRVQVMEQVRAFAAHGGSALIVSHDLGLAAQGCDRLALLAAGELRAAGPPREVLRRDLLRDVFGVAADLVESPGGAIVVLPRLEG
jgi:iron complex transport system ATP-binding protein